MRKGGERPQRRLYNTSVRENDTAPAANQSHPHQQTNAHNGGSARGRCGCCAANVFGIANTRTNSPFVFVHIAQTGTQPEPSSRSLNPALPPALVAFVCTRVASRLCAHLTHLACRIPDLELHDRIAQLDGLREEGGCRGAESTTSKRMQKKREGEDWTQQRMVLVRRVGSHEQAVRARADHPAHPCTASCGRTSDGALLVLKELLDATVTAAATADETTAARQPLLLAPPFEQIAAAACAFPHSSLPPSGPAS